MGDVRFPFLIQDVRAATSLLTSEERLPTRGAVRCPRLPASKVGGTLEDFREAHATNARHPAARTAL